MIGITLTSRGSPAKGRRPDIGAFEIATSLNKENRTVVSVQRDGVQDSALLE